MFHCGEANETIVTHGPEYSVSHFIDCHPVALRLSASLSGLIVEQT
jgi:cytochrome b involved in lipid metabolism